MVHVRANADLCVHFQTKSNAGLHLESSFCLTGFFSVHHLVTNFTCVLFDAFQVAYTSVFRICFVLLYVFCCLEQLPSWNETTGHLFIEINYYSSFKCTICNSCH